MPIDKAKIEGDVDAWLRLDAERAAAFDEFYAACPGQSKKRALETPYREMNGPARKAWSAAQRVRGFWLHASPPAVRSLLAEREEMLSLLREVEWKGDANHGMEYGHVCPVCDAHRDQATHAPDCRLSALLK